MVLKAQNPENSKNDWLKWSIAMMALVAGVAANYYYSAIALPIRIGVGAVIVAFVAFVIAQTQKGQWALQFVKDARNELRKVTWPTREETTQTTLVVAAMVIILALLLWGMDSVLMWLVGWLTGQRG
jgi:preprotein translocase subunit SecE